MSEHSIYSPSSFEAAMLCPGKPAMEHGKPDRSSIHSATGTVAHTKLASLLQFGLEPERGEIAEEEGYAIEVDEDMILAIKTAETNIRKLTEGAELLVEQRVNFADYIGVPRDQGWGTADVIAVVGTELQVHDYKHGVGVPVSAEDNVQMRLYALGALTGANEASPDGHGLTTVRMVIHQPRVKDAPAEWVQTVEEVEAWGRTSARSAAMSRTNAWRLRFEEPIPGYQWEETFLRPGEDQCRFCRARAECSALRREVVKIVFDSEPATPDEFAAMPAPDPIAAVALADGAWLGAVMGKAGLVEDFITAVRAEVERRLVEGHSVPGYKLVEGRKGNRTWKDPLEAESHLKAMRLKTEEMYDLKLISPTTAEKLAKAKVIGPRQWTKIQPLIERKDGKPSVAPETDPRPALTLTPVVEEFNDVSVDLLS